MLARSSTYSHIWFDMSYMHSWICTIISVITCVFPCLTFLQLHLLDTTPTKVAGTIAGCWLVDFTWWTVGCMGQDRPARLEWSSNMIQNDMLKNLRRASVLVFTRRRTLNPKNPRKPENSESKSRKHCVYLVFSAISLLMFDDRESSMLQSGQTTGSVRIASTKKIGKPTPTEAVIN